MNLQGGSKSEFTLTAHILKARFICVIFALTEKKLHQLKLSKNPILMTLKITELQKSRKLVFSVLITSASKAALFYGLSCNKKT